MSEENKSATIDTNADIAILKGDLDTKLSAVNAQIEAMNAQFTRSMNDLAGAVTSSRQPTQRQSEEKLDPYSPEYADQLAERIAARSDAATNRAIQVNMEKQSMLASLTNDYPELNDSASDFSKQVVKNHQLLDKSLQGTATGYKLAAREAAAELGVIIRSKRASSEEFMVKGSSQQASRKPAKEAELSDETIATAELMGLDLSDEKVVARLKTYRSKFGDIKVSKYK